MSPKNKLLVLPFRGPHDPPATAAVQPGRECPALETRPACRAFAHGGYKAQKTDLSEGVLLGGMGWWRGLGMTPSLEINLKFPPEGSTLQPPRCLSIKLTCHWDYLRVPGKKHSICMQPGSMQRGSAVPARAAACALADTAGTRSAGQCVYVR